MKRESPTLGKGLIQKRIYSSSSTPFAAVLFIFFFQFFFSVPTADRRGA